MASKIELNPEILLSQASEMQSLTSEYESLFSKVTSNLNDTNNNWSELLANNFSGKISSAQQSFSNITTLLSSGAAAARNSAQTLQSMDQSLSKAFGESTGEGVTSEQVQNMIDTIKDYEAWEKKSQKASLGESELESSFVDVWADISEDYENMPTWVKEMINTIDAARGADVKVTDILKRFSKLGKLAEKIEEGSFDWRNDGSGLAEVFDFSKGKMYKEVYDVVYGTNAKGTQIIRDAEDAYSTEINRYMEKGDYLNAAGSLGKCMAFSAFGEVYNIFDVGAGMVGNTVEKYTSMVGNAVLSFGEGLNIVNGNNAIGNAAVAVGNAINWFGKKSNEGWHKMF